MDNTRRDIIEMDEEEEEPQRPSKKRKLDHDVDEDEEPLDLTSIARMNQQRRFLLGSLSDMKKKYPKEYKAALEFGSNEFAQLSDKELANLLQIVQLEVGLIQPYSNARSVIDLAGHGVDRALGTEGIVSDVRNDLEIVSALDNWLLKFNLNSGNLNLFEKLVGFLTKNIFPPRKNVPPVPPMDHSPPAPIHNGAVIHTPPSVASKVVMVVPSSPAPPSASISTVPPRVSMDPPSLTKSSKYPPTDPNPNGTEVRRPTKSVPAPIVETISINSLSNDALTNLIDGPTPTGSTSNSNDFPNPALSPIDNRPTGSRKDHRRKKDNK
jgi:hypothetical protein